MSETERLIELVKERPYLYDLNNFDYKNRQKRMEAWQQICQEMGAGTANIWSSKWKGLKDNYAKYKKTSKPAFAKAYRKYKHWPWSEHVRFLDDCTSVGSRRIYSSQNTGAGRTTMYSSPATGTTEQTQEPKFCNVQLIIPNNNLTSSIDEMEDPVPEGSENFNESKKRRITDITEPTVKPTLDGIDHFFLSYAQSFKQLPNRMQIMLKLEIATLFSRYELQAEGVTKESVDNIPRILPHSVKCEIDFTNTIDQ